MKYNFDQEIETVFTLFEEAMARAHKAMMSARYEELVLAQEDMTYVFQFINHEIYEEAISEHNWGLCDRCNMACKTMSKMRNRSYYVSLQRG